MTMQTNSAGELTHLLTLEGMPKEQIVHILDTAQQFVSVTDPAREVKKVPLLRGKSVFNLFFENSTRTRTTFEIAANRLSADVINLDISTSSTAKGESLMDTIDNLIAMQADIFVVRHSVSRAPIEIANHVPPYVHVINAGDGSHQHPTQGLLDMYTMRHFKKDFTKLKVAIVGDIVHSRVAKSNIHALTALGCTDIRAIGPESLLPTDLDLLGVKVFHSMEEGLRGVDVVMIDTAGRLPTQLHLMDELKKIRRVIGKGMEGAPHEVLLVIDGNTGQNALAQVKAFDDALSLTGLIGTSTRPEG